MAASWFALRRSLVGLRCRDASHDVTLAPLGLDPDRQQAAQLVDQDPDGGGLGAAIPLLAVEVLEQLLMRDKLSRRPRQPLQQLPFHRGQPDRHVIDSEALLFPVHPDPAPRPGIHREQRNSEAKCARPSFQRVGRWRRHPPFPVAQRGLREPAAPADLLQVQPKRPAAGPQLVDDLKIATHDRRPH